MVRRVRRGEAGCGAPNHVGPHQSWGTPSPTTGHHTVGPHHEGLPTSWVHYSQGEGGGLPASRPARLPVVVVKGRPGHHMRNTPMRDTNWGIPRTIEQTEGEEKGVGGPVRPPTPPAGGFSVCAAAAPLHSRSVSCSGGWGFVGGVGVGGWLWFFMCLLLGCWRVLLVLGCARLSRWKEQE